MIGSADPQVLCRVVSRWHESTTASVIIVLETQRLEHLEMAEQLHEENIMNVSQKAPASP